MALNLNAAGEAVKRTTNVPDENSDFTQLFWWRLTADSVNAVISYVGDNPATNYLTYMLFFVTAGQTLQFDVNLNSGSPSSLTTGAVVTNNWYPFAYTRSGSTHNFYFNGVLIGSVTKDWSTSATPVNNLWLGDDSGGIADFNQQFFGYREYDRALTLAELITEWNSAAAVDSSDIVADCPLVSDDDDDSGNGNDFTSVGSVTFVDGPTQVPLTNTTGATAKIVSALDDEGFVQVVRNSSGITQSVAYTYTATTGQLVFGAKAFSQVSGYTPTVSVYDADTLGFGDIYNGIANYPARPIEIPVLTDGIQLWIRVISNIGNPVAVVWIRFTSFTQQTAASGSFLINDAGNGPSVALISSSDGEPKQLRNGFVPGELATILHDQGRMMHQDINDLTTPVVIHNDQLVEVTRIAATNLRDVKGDRDVLFYVADDVGAHDEIRSYSRDGVLNTTYSIDPSAIVVHIAPDPAAFDIIYSNSNAPAAPIRRFSRSANAFISDLAPGIANYTPKEMLWLNGNTLLVVYRHSTTATAAFVRRYDCTDGSTLNDYTSQFSARSGNASDIHIASDYPVLNPEVYFNLWIKIANGYSRFFKIRISDGVTIDTFDRVHFTNGSADNVTEDYGHSESCNFLKTDTSVPPPGGGGETGTIIVNKVTVPSGAAQSFDFTAGGGLSPDSFSLQDGDSQVYVDIEPGAGYSIEETPVEGWDTTYEVSNDETNDNTNISVAAGETVTVTVTNTSTDVGSVTVRKITANSLSTLTFLFTLEGEGIPTSTVELANGEEHTFENIPAGSGYTLSETQLATGWEITSVIINGSPAPTSSPITIEVEPDVETVVIVTNTFTPTEGSGIYFIEPDKRNDTLWRANNDTKIVKIPDPNFTTALLGE